MRLKVLPLVTFLIIIFALSFAQANDQNFTYADGYQDGKKAAKVDVRNDQNPYFSSSKYLTLPNHRIEQIENKPNSYQKGFKEGYKETAKQALVESPNYWSGYILALGGIVGIAVLISLF